MPPAAPPYRRLSILVLLAVLSCAHPQETAGPAPARLSVADVAALLPPRVRGDERRGWATDIVAAIEATRKPVTAERACAVIAVIEQESGFVADPTVADLPAIVRAGLDDKLAPLGPLRAPAVAWLLEQRTTDGRSLAARMDALKTERDLDRLYRDIAAALRDQAGAPLLVGEALSALVGRSTLDDLNPITTAGSMQVKVSFARAVGAADGLNDEEVRELLYTRAGGVRFGTARLLGYQASYDDVRFRFADYNAGVYASRNAAWQAQLAALTGRTLVLDGDVLAWDERGAPLPHETHTLAAAVAWAQATPGAPSAAAVRRDAEQEKTRAFEDTDTYRMVRAAWAAKQGATPPYARVPAVALASPKLKGPRTTAWFTDNVRRRYDACRARPLSPSGPSTQSLQNG